MSEDRLEQQIRFIVEVDNLKQVFRQSLLLADGRQENDAEHSWHLALMAVLLAEYAEAKIEPLRVVKMLLVHDLVEIDAGDTFAYDEQAMRDKRDREVRAAERIFGELPADQATELRELWDEFEEARTPEARYAVALDRFQPVLLNLHSGGEGWRRHGVTKEQVVEYNRHIAQGSPALWQYVYGKLEEAVKAGVLEE